MEQDHLGGFGDVRLSRVGGALLAAMQSKRTMCVHALGHSRSESRQLERFLDNDAVRIHEMLVHSGRQTGCRAAGRHVLAICDTSEPAASSAASARSATAKISGYSCIR